ncbi:MAG: T9SS type A sorting domain-containing protein [Bacteroidota bacterium]|nr:T9SS type A sorting domain-containing protein [Bacteroidota bacterium]
MKPFLHIITPEEKVFTPTKYIAIVVVFLSFFAVLIPSFLNAQKLEFSYSYFNLTRNNGGGTLEQGDTIEVHALVKVNSTTNNFYYIDTIPAGTQYINNSIKLVTNEDILFSGSGPYTDASNDDAGVYISSAPARVRVNIYGSGTGYSNARNGGNFGITTGGGKVVSGTTLPKFYGKTLFMVAYKLLITANNGDTIHPTGNYYFDTSGVNTTFRFNYAGIKVIQNQGLCNNFSSASFTADSSFGSGNTQNSPATAIAPGYIHTTLGLNSPQDNYYSIANNTSADGTTNNAGPYKPTTNNSRVFGGFWDIIGDHTGASNPALGNAAVAPGTVGGYMLVVNAAYTTGEAYRDTIKNVCPNTYYEFSAWVRNICGVCGSDVNSNATYTPGVLPNLSYTINDVDYYTTGNIQHDNNWQKRGFIYKTGPTETQFAITIKNNAAGGGGNDWVIDDIKLATCYPNLTMNPKDTSVSCAGSNLSLSDTVRSYFNNYTNFCWEKSADGINWTSTGVCGTKVPVLNNGLYEYVVDTAFTPTSLDSGAYFRLKVGTTASNLTNSLCSVNGSQSVFLKVYTAGCKPVSADFLNFYGKIMNNKSSLKWVAQNEENLKEYQVEKSTDGVSFSKVGTVDALNNINDNNYLFNDPGNISNVAYYRLKLISQKFNSYKYSKIIVLYNRDAPFKITTVNPFRNNLNIDIFTPEGGFTEINLCDIYGKIVSKKSLQLAKGDSNVELDNVSGLPSGLYILRAINNGVIVQNKLIKTD